MTRRPTHPNKPPHRYSIYEQTKFIYVNDDNSAFIVVETQEIKSMNNGNRDKITILYVYMKEKVQNYTICLHKKKKIVKGSSMKKSIKPKQL